VVPRLPEFSGFLFLLNDFQIRGVQLESKMDGIDVILDDGSHVSAHIITLFETLFPRLKKGGLLKWTPEMGPGA
jgi:hypothetical protein